MRPHAPDAQRFDRFVEQWFFDVVVPEFRLHDARRDRSGELWAATARLENFGTGEVEVEVAAVAGERWREDGERGDDYREARVTVALGAGESREVRIEAPFEPAADRRRPGRRGAAAAAQRGRGRAVAAPACAPAEGVGRRQASCRPPAG